jgi:hypothetical protein
MITFNQLGNLGRLGNQMFQYASLVGISKNIKTDYSIPEHDSIVLYEYFNIPNKFSNHQNVNVFYEDKYEFDEYMFNNCDPNTDLFGFFQSEKYFKHVKGEIKKHFTFKDDLKEICKSFILKNFLDQDVISLHIRRGDYLTDGNFFNLSIHYYMTALKLLPKFPVIIFSDDVEWCRTQKEFESDRFILSETYDEGMDMCLMSMCKYHIIANSSFSWWGSWLADSKQTIAPQNWFAGEFANWNTRDLYLPNWIVL